MSKPKVPKGTKNANCVAVLPDNVRQDYLDMYANRNQGDPEVQEWSERQKFEYEQYRYRMELHMLANSRLGQAVQNHRKGVWKGALGTIAQDRWEGAAGLASVEARSHAIKGKMNSILSDMIDKYRPRALGFSRDREGMKNVVREVFGKATGDQEASAYAQAWKKMAEYTRKRLTDAGASVGRIAGDEGIGWGLPQHHNPARISAMGREQWMELLYETLDWDRMVKESGLSPDELDDIIRFDIFDSIVTDGATKVDLTKISGLPQGKGLLNRLQQHRFLHFYDGDSWLKYQDAAGSDDYLTAMMDFVNHQSLNLAAMEVLGPNPDIGYQHLRNLIKLSGETDKLDYLDRVYKNTLGHVGTSSQAWAERMAGIRSFNVMAHLGNATLSMITDPAFLTMTAKINDVPAFSALRRQIAMTAAGAFGNTKDLKFASQIGFVSEYAADRLLSAARFTDVAPNKFAARLSEITVRASGMHAITVAGRAAFSLEYAAALAKDAKTPWAKLSKRRQEAFARVGINEYDWNVIRGSQKVNHRGVDYVDINNVGRGGNRETATKLGALVSQEMNYAVPMPGAEMRAWQNQGHKRGTVPGEAFRSAFEFKSFPMTIFMTHFRRIQYQQAMNKYTYGGGLIALLVGLGAFATDAKDISQGRDPASFVDDDGTPNFAHITRVLAQSGALGIYGDLAFADWTRFGQSLGQTVIGPTGGLFDDTMKTGYQGMAALIESLTDADDKEVAKFKNRIGKNVQKYKPEIWQFRAAMDRAVNQAMNAWTDDDWADTLYSADKRRRKELGQEKFWADDAALPDRPPRIIEGRFNPDETLAEPR